MNTSKRYFGKYSEGKTFDQRDFKRLKATTDGEKEKYSKNINLSAKSSCSSKHKEDTTRGNKFQTHPLKHLCGWQQRTNDTIHHSIHFFPALQALVDTPAGQRLKRLKQLGCTATVYMNAIHTRFEHSTGVAHLAGLLCRRIQNFQPFLNVTEKDHHCVVIAGFCHDWGHGPFSHIFDGRFQNSLKKRGLLETEWEHEDLSLMLIDAMLAHLGLEMDESNMDKPLKQVGDGIRADCFGVYSTEIPLPKENIFTTRDFVFVKECIIGKPLKGNKVFLGRGWSKHFLYDIVNNTHSGLDVDKMDYYARDTHSTLGFGQVEQLLIEEAFVARAHSCDAPNCFRCKLDPISNGDSEQTNLMICYPKKRIVKAMDFFKTRFRLHTDVYTHKTCVAAELMICDILLLANPHIQIRDDSNGSDKYQSISTAVSSPNSYLRLDDSIIDIILANNDPNLKPAHDLIDRFKSRKLYKCVCSERLMRQKDHRIWDMDDNLVEETILSEILEIRDEILSSQQQQRDFANSDNTNFLVDNYFNFENSNNSSTDSLGTNHQQDLANFVTFEEDELIIDIRRIHHGMKDTNPVGNMRFLSKYELFHIEGRCASQLPIATSVEEENYECHIPRAFYEKSLRAFCRSLSEETYDSIKVCIREWLRRERNSDLRTITLSQQ